jgi:hypothetical protein
MLPLASYLYQSILAMSSTPRCKENIITEIKKHRETWFKLETIPVAPISKPPFIPLSTLLQLWHELNLAHLLTGSIIDPSGPTYQTGAAAKYHLRARTADFPS